MVMDEWGNPSVGVMQAADEACDGLLDFIKGEWYEFQDINDEWIGVEDESAKMTEEDGGMPGRAHCFYIYGRSVIARERRYDEYGNLGDVIERGEAKQ